MRGFIAINLPEAERQRIHDVARPLRTAELPIRWVEPAAYHVTLAFLGDVAPAAIRPIEAAILEATAGVSRFPLELGRLELVPTPRRPRVFWLEVAVSPELKGLHNGLLRTLREAGFALEDRAFRPHLTLGRVRRSARPTDFASLPERTAALDFAGTSIVASVDLMQSKLSTKAARYSVVSKTPLDRPH